MTTEQMVKALEELRSSNDAGTLTQDYGTLGVSLVIGAIIESLLTQSH